MTPTAAILTALGGSISTVLLGLLGWFGLKRVRAAQARDTDASAVERQANARRTDAETWDLMNKGLVQTVERLGEEVSTLRTQHRAALAHIVAVHEWDARGRHGAMPSAPEDLNLS